MLKENKQLLLVTVLAIAYFFMFVSSIRIIRIRYERKRLFVIVWKLTNYFACLKESTIKQAQFENCSGYVGTTLKCGKIKKVALVICCLCICEIKMGKTTDNNGNFINISKNRCKNALISWAGISLEPEPCT